MTSLSSRPIICTFDKVSQRILCKARDARFGNFFSRVAVPLSERFSEFLFNPIFAAELLWMLCSGCSRATAFHLPIHNGQKVEGRSGRQWHISVTSYLRFRAGSDWRPVRHSGVCEVGDYRDALRVVLLAWNTPMPGRPVRKPVQSIKALGKKAGVA